ncbi:N-acetylmuramoyl-L-alanine amidase [Nocardiopsis composta]
MKLERRSVFGWGATAAGHAPCDRGLVIHYDSGNLGLHAKDHSACRTYWKNTRRFHMGPSRGWADLGYAFGVCPHGIVMEGRGAKRAQAAQPGGNTTWTSCTLMTGPAEDITPAAIEGVRQLRAWLRTNHGLGTGVRGHRDFISTSCPGDKAYALVRNGTFSKPPGSGGVEDDLIGLSKGSKGEGVEAVQEMVRLAGHGKALGRGGVDGIYGPGTAEGCGCAARTSGPRPRRATVTRSPATPWRS